MDTGETNNTRDDKPTPFFHRDSSFFQKTTIRLLIIRGHFYKLFPFFIFTSMIFKI